jgi:ABC-2 type transport system ATP-binding protein
MEPALALRDVRKTFGRTTAVDGISLDLPRGALCGVIGPNGAGKTTCIRMIMSILFPDSGTLSVLGRRSALDAKDRIGYLPEERGVYRKMRVGAFLRFVGQLKGMRGADASRRVPELLERIGLPGVDDKRCEDLSKGMLQRVQFAATVMHGPDLLILDEPFSGLDPVSFRLLRDYVLDEHRRGATVLLSTHVMAQAEELCERVVMIHRGRKVLDEPMDGLRRRYDPRTVLFEPLDPAADLTPLRAVPGVETVEPAGGTYRVRLGAGVDPASCLPRMAAAVAPARLELARLRLEDVFVRIVADGGEAEGATLLATLQEDRAEVTA